MRNDVRFWTAAAILAATAACGGQQPARHPNSDPSKHEDVDSAGAADSTDAADSADSTDVAAKGGSSESSPQSDSATVPQGKDKKDRGIAEICERLHRRAASKCPKKIAELYQESCQHYLKKPGDCVNEIRATLECQYKAKDEILCAHQADPNCTDANRALKVCERGSAPEEQTTTESVALPSGWEVVSDSQLGFKVAMPPGASLDAASKRRTWKAEEGGVTYYVAAIEPPAGKLNNQAFVRAVIAYVGSRCQLRLKLRGELETKGTTVVQYESGCPDGTEWHGMLHFWNGKAVSTGFHGPAGATGVLEPFFYSFAIAK